jgi:hypothetical protein
MEDKMYRKKKMASWEIKYGQILLSGENNLSARDIFKDYFGKTFTLNTFKGTYKNVNFLNKLAKSNVRLCCSRFVKQLKMDDIIYISIENDDTIKISQNEPINNVINNQKKSKKYTEDELKDIIIELTKENQKLKENNSQLLEYKDQLDKYESLDKIFKDEKFMEDWLERNIHKVVSDLDVIDRQITISWPDLNTSRLDLLCIDKTTKELVVVENKVRGRNKTLETQYLTYKAWVANNIDNINEKYKDFNLKATSNFKFVIITDTIDDKIENMCNGNNIPLIFINGGVIFEEIVPYDN